MSHKSGFAGPVTVAAVGVLVLLPLFYILSTGPVIGLVARGYVSESAMIAVYSPISFVCDRCTPLDDGMRWYVDLFRPADEFEIQTDVIYGAPVDPSAVPTIRKPPPVY